MHRGITRVIVAMLGVLGAFALLAGVAQAKGNTITATVTDADKAPIAGVVVMVEGPDGFANTGKTGADGKATIEVPKSGKYDVAVDEKTIPGGANVKDGPTR